MPANIVVPQVGEGVAEVWLLEWLKQPGDSVRKGEALFRLDTDKAVVEVEAFADGVLTEILAPAGSAVQSQQVVGRLDDSAGAANASGAEGGEAAAAVSGLDPAGSAGSGVGGQIAAEDARQQAATSIGPDAGPASVQPARRV